MNQIGYKFIEEADKKLKFTNNEIKKINQLFCVFKNLEINRPLIKKPKDNSSEVIERIMRLGRENNLFKIENNENDLRSIAITSIIIDCCNAYKEINLWWREFYKKNAILSTNSRKS